MTIQDGNVIAIVPPEKNPNRRKRPTGRRGGPAGWSAEVVGPLAGSIARRVPEGTRSAPQTVDQKRDSAEGADASSAVSSETNS